MRNNLGLFLAKRAQLAPERCALVEVERDRRFTYRELDARTNRCANALLALGVSRGDRVAVLMMNGAEYIETYYALAKIGAILVPLNWRLVPDEIEFIVGDAGATVLVHDAEFDEAAAELAQRATPIQHFVRVAPEAAGTGRALHYEALLAEAADAPPEITGGDDDDLFIMYTSGTTGLPKGVVHTHATMTAASLTVNMTADMRMDDRYLQMLPLFHVGALLPLTAALHRGCTLVMLRAFDPARVFPIIEAERVNCGLAVPAMLNFMLAANNASAHDHSSLRWLQCGAAPVPVPLIERYAELGIEVHQVYGLTESGGPACVIGSEESLRKAGSAGPAFFHTDVRVVDDAGRDVPAGAHGEVIIRAAHVMKGYWNRPDETAKVLKGGWLYSGDIGTMDEDGFVYIQDRKKDMIISGGENVYPAEIENLLAGHPEVADVAVIGQPSKKWGEAPAAIVVPRPGTTPREDALLQWCEGKLARFKTPLRVEFVDAIPRNPTGKILKRVLRERFAGPAPE